MKDKIFEILGIRPHERFYFKTIPNEIYFIMEDGTVWKKMADGTPVKVDWNIITIADKYEDLMKLPAFSKEEKVLLEALDIMGFKCIARDNDRQLHTYNDDIEKGCIEWTFSDNIDGNYIKLPISMFNMVTWTDEEPLNIKEALKWLK